MTRKAGQDADETRRHLLESAKHEFARFGYQKASLRTICANAGVTTGALYFFFKNKEDLFRVVISPVSKALPAVLEDIDLLGEVGTDGNIQSTQDMIDVMFADPEVTHIVLDNRDNPAVEEFHRNLIGVTEQQVRALVEDERAAGVELGDSAIGWYARVQTDTLLDVFVHCENRDDAARRLRTTVAFLHGGIEALLEDASAGVRAAG